MSSRDVKRTFYEVNIFAAIIFSALFFSCISKHNNQSMEIADVIKGQYDLDRFIHDNFDKIDYGDTAKSGFGNPTFPYKMDFINRTDSLKFCTMNIQQCWLKKINDLYAFFIIIKTTADVQKNISTVFGKCSASAMITSQGTSIGNGLFVWRREDLNIDQMSYFNLS